MKRAIIFLHGNKPSKKLVKKHSKKSDFVICADGGAEYAIDSGITPDVIIGDQDSISPSLKKTLQNRPIEWVTYSRDKDETDSELALLYVIEKGYKNILIFAASGNRIDHFFSNILLLAKNSTSLNIQIIEETQHLYFVTSKKTIPGVPGEYISLVPILSDVSGITTTGLKYSLTNESLLLGKTRGVSNEFLKTKSTVTLKTGVLLVIHTTTNSL